MKKLYLFFLLFFISIILFANSPIEYLQEAIQLSKNKKYPEALDKYLLFYADRNSQSEPLWLSFGIAWWGKIAEKFEPAREELLAIRDSGITEIKSGKNPSEDRIQEIFMINRAMQDIQNTVALFEYLDQNHEQLARQVWDFNILAQPLVEDGRYLLAAKYMDTPVDELSEILLEYQKILNNLPRNGMEKALAVIFEEKALTLVDICIGADKENSNDKLEFQLGNAVKMLEENSEARQLSGVQYFIGVCYDYGYGVAQNSQTAVDWYRKAAEQGNDMAQNSLGYAFENGEGIEQNFEKATKWYREAAEQGNDSAQVNLAYCYMQGIGVVQNYSEAVKWYKLAAQQGNPDAQSGLGYCYLKGLGIKEDLSEAVKWYILAAEQGDIDAQVAVGHFFSTGKGVKQDSAEAIKWYKLAAEKGNETAIQRLKEL